MFSGWQKPFRGTQLNKTHPLVKGLVGCWLFNEATGTKIFDLSGNSRNGSINNNVSWVSRGLYSAGGNSDEVEIGTFPGLATGGLSIATKAEAPEYVAWDRVIQRGNGDTNGWALRNYNTTYGFIFQDPKVSSSNNYRTGAVSPNVPHSIVATSDRVAMIKIYKNGILQPTGTLTDSAGSTGSGLTFFKRAGAAGNGFHGTIYYIYIWNRILSDAEAMLLHHIPYCMFEQPSRAKYFYVAPPAGIIPQAMNTYRQMRA